MSTKFNMTRDVAGYNGFGLAPSDDSYSATLAADDETSMDVPNEYPYYLAVFSYTPGSNVFVNFSDTASEPSGSFTNDGNVLNPSARLVKANAEISLLTPDSGGAYVSITFYVAPPFGN